MSGPLFGLDLTTARNVLCIQPHYDDNDLGAGGTVARLKSLGATVTYLTVSDDLVGVRDPDLGDDEARVLLDEEQRRAGEILGVDAQINLGYPDAGRYDYFDLRKELIAHMRRVRPDFVVTVDPWLPYEAHNDHVMTGRAAAEASYLQAMTRMKTFPEVDEAYEPYDVSGVAFYFTDRPNITVDITEFHDLKHRAFDQYGTQLGPEDLAMLHAVLELKEREWAEPIGATFAETFRLLHPLQLHVGLEPPAGI